MDIVAIGMGDVEQAADFADRYRIPFPLLVDEAQQTYGIMGLDRGSLNQIVGPKVWLPAARNFLAGTTPTATSLDMKQLGGLAIVASGGEVVHVHRATTSADNLPIPKVLEHLP